MTNNKNNTKKYEDIINLPHHISRKRPQMPVANRAAQFAPFAALSGYGEAIRETARHTENFIHLTDEEKERINNKLICAIATGCPQAEITYFRPDGRKSGGSYITVTGKILKILPHSATVLTEDGEIPLKYIVAVDLGTFDY